MGGSLDEEEIKFIKLRYPFISTFIEAGTYHGDTTKLASVYFDRIHTIEIHPGLFSEAKKILSNYKNVVCHQGKSIDHLKKICNDNKGESNEKIFFFLDAHLSGSDTYCDEVKTEEVPLLEELKYLSSLGQKLKNSVICIDDVRLWHEDKWGNLSPEKINKIFTDNGIQIQETYVKNDRYYVFLNYMKENKNTNINENINENKNTTSSTIDYEESKEAKIVSSKKEFKRKKIIAFFLDHFTFRGTNMAVYDYAKYNQEILLNISIIIYCLKNKNEEELQGKLLFKEFPLLKVNDSSSLEQILKQEAVDVLYTIGKDSGFVREENKISSSVSTNTNIRIKQSCFEINVAEKLRIKCVRHCVLEMGYLPSSLSLPKSLTKYIGVSKSVSEKVYSEEYVFKKNSVPKYKEKDTTTSDLSNKPLYLNHIVTLPEIESDYRDYLGIPKNAIVYGRHGGMDTFDIPFVKTAIEKIIQVRDDIYFLFAGEIPYMFLMDTTDKNEKKEDKKLIILESKQIIFISPFYDKNRKRKFINTCDYMIHAGRMGESFGLSCLEFDYCGKKVLAYNNKNESKDNDKNISPILYNTSHIEELTESGGGIFYSGYIELINLFLNNKTSQPKGDRVMTIKRNNQKFTPNKIMKEFAKFIE
jgi:hypothetical protein